MSTIRILLSILIVALLYSGLSAQTELIDGVIVETYYISDVNDATDADGGYLEPASVTYRVFLDMAAGVRFRRLFGLGQDTLVISSTEVFFNNQDRGELLGSEIGANRLDENTVALDSWLTIGLSSEEHFGVLKSMDSDGSIIGGEMNDGGSEAIQGGLLSNQDPEAGIPLTDADGLLMVQGSLPSVTLWGTNAAQQLNVVFGTENLSSTFKSSDIYLLPDQPMTGNDVENRILLGQFTTKGELSFALNVELESPNGEVFQFVADSTDNERYNPFLIYPLPELECGCTDPYYLEYNAEAFCSDEDLCQTLIIIGCTDPAACNYDSEANFNYPSLCCYGPDSCGAGLDFNAICDPLTIVEPLEDMFTLYPNPVHEVLTIIRDGGLIAAERIEIFDSNGRLVKSVILIEKAVGRIDIPMHDLPFGVYSLALCGQKFRKTYKILKLD